MAKSLILSVLLIIFVGTSIAQVHEIPLNRNKSKQNTIQKSKSETRYTFSHDFIYCKSTTSKNGLGYTNIWLKNSYPNGLVGEPNIPAYKKLIIIPKGIKPTLRIVSSTEQFVNLKENGVDMPISPNQPSVSKNQDTSKLEFVINKASYLKKSYSNKPIATIEVLGNLRSATVARLVINPIDYNPGNGLLKIYNDIEIEVDYSGATKTVDEQVFDPKTYSPYFETVYKTLGQSSSAYAEHPDLTKYPVKMLIISNRMFEQTLQHFIQWKITKGFDVKTVYTDIIGTTPAQIKSYIQQEYNSATPESPAPSFLVIVGDVEQVPASAIGTETSRKTDLYYASIDGDMFPDIYYGRLSATNTSQLENIINKILYYEKYQFNDASYLNKVTLIAGVDGTGWTSKVGVPTIKYSTANYFNESKGYTTVNEYGVSSDPSNPNSTAGYVGCYNSDRIGVSFINYTAHGSETSWVDPSLGTAAISAFSNLNKYPLVIGNCCVTADFGFSSECLGEAWIRAQNKGAVAYIGSSPNSFWYEDFYWSVGAFPIIGSNDGYVPTFQETTTGAYDAPFVSNYITLGGIVFAGNLAVTEVNLQGFQKTQSSSDLYYWEGYNILGDPSLIPFFTEAETNQVSYSESVVVGQTSMNVNALENSCVAISKNGQLLGSKFYTTTGEESIAISNLNDLGDVIVTITRPQTIPIIDTIQAVSPTGPFLILDSFTIDDSGSNNNERADYNETFSTNIIIKNIGIENATNVKLKILGGDIYTSINGNDSISASDIPSDLGSNTINILNAFTFITQENIPDQHITTFTLKFYSDQGQWNSKLKIRINSPILSVGNLQIDDNLPGGDNDGLINPGESCNLLVSFINEGHSLAKDISLTISIPDSLKDIVSVSEIQNTLFSLAENDTSIIPFNIAIDASLRQELIIPIKLQATVVEPSGLTQLFEKYIEVTHKGINMSSASVSTCFTYFYDSGGKTGDYKNGENYTLTFSSPSSDNWFKVSMLEFETEANYDFLSVYNGSGDDSPQVLGSPFSGTTIPESIVSIGNYLTFKFTSDQGIIAKGWKAMVECVDPQIPECVKNPNPCVAEELVKSTKLTWDALPLASFYDVYIGTESNNLTFLERVQKPEITFIPEKSKTYYWRVKPGNILGVNNDNCNLWSFTTDTISAIEMSTNIVEVDKILFYDSGGPFSNYKNNENYTLTFKPRIQGQEISVSFLDFNIEPITTNMYDNLKIYNGLTTNSPLIGTYCGTDSPQTIKASNPDGALTFNFYSDGTEVFSGWKAIINSEKSTNTPIITDKKIRVYPNPVSNIVNIDSDYPIKKITLINSIGSTIISKEVSQTKQETLSLAGEVPGVYILIIYTENSIPEKTLIIKK